jgi:hypothetical protein
MKIKYTGEDERVFPTLGITVKSGDEFDAPKDFVQATQSIPTPAKSAAPDTTVDEVK